MKWRDVRVGSISAIRRYSLNVCFTPDSDHCADIAERPRCANRRHMRCSKKRDVFIR
jgi:hypothetical protein